MTWGILQIFTRAHSKVWKVGLLLSPFTQSSKCMSLMYLQRSYVPWKQRMMQKLKKTWLLNSKLPWGIWWFFTWALENLKNLHFNGLLLTKVYNVWGKKKYWGVMFDGTEDWCKIWRKTDLCFLKLHEEFGKFSFTGWKIPNIILKIKIAELNQNKNSKQPDLPDAVWKLCFTLEINE